LTGPTAMADPASSRHYPCGGCGARLEFTPGSTVLTCPYCGFSEQVAEAQRPVREHSYDDLAALPRKPVSTLAAHVFVCGRCGAQTSSDALSESCQFCGAPMTAEINPADQIVPEAVLPFEVDRAGVRSALQAWVKSRWFAPSRLKKVTEAESVKGTYLPHWTFDSRTVSHYRGQRGEYYWETETVTRTVDGKTETTTQQVRKTRWYPVSGTVARDFDDVLVPGTGQVDNQRLDGLAPWPLERATAFQPAFLAGFQTLRYDVEPEAGLQEAKRRMAKVIEEDCERDIGGDEQRVTSVHTRYSDITYKLMLLPVWIACYLYAGKTYQVLVNGRTGKVVGERPYSKLKIAAAILAAVVALIVIVLFVNRNGG
jgi:DNA-directed RNA polymerase subunit RPC12/RpoP